MKSKFKRHFRIYLLSKHPAYIVGEDAKYYYFHRVTSSPKSGHHSNWKVDPNPDPKRKSPMYIIKQEQRDLKRNFSSKLEYNANIMFIKRKKKATNPVDQVYSARGL